MARDKNGDFILHVEGKDVLENTFKLLKSGVEFSWETKSTLDALGEAQRQVFLFIKKNVGCTQSDIVAKTGKNKPQVSHIVIRLCSEGHISKEDHKLFINIPY